MLFGNFSKSKNIYMRSYCRAIRKEMKKKGFKPKTDNFDSFIRLDYKRNQVTFVITCFIMTDSLMVNMSARYGHRSAGVFCQNFKPKSLDFAAGNRAKQISTKIVELIMSEDDLDDRESEDDSDDQYQSTNLYRPALEALAFAAEINKASNALLNKSHNYSGKAPSGKGLGKGDRFKRC